MMFPHFYQHEKRPSIPLGEVDRTPEIVALFQRDELSASTANLLLGIARARTLGFAARLGRRRLLATPGIGRRTVDELERVAARYGVQVTP